jgi:hypothetical protein
MCYVCVLPSLKREFSKRCKNTNKSVFSKFCLLFEEAGMNKHGVSAKKLRSPLRKKSFSPLNPRDTINLEVGNPINHSGSSFSNVPQKFYQFPFNKQTPFLTYHQQTSAS